ncbi:general secretion pathway protein GspK [Zavarzinia sp. CC-PAN008]|uniref:general secretion pathway protein GspK n=1 Tax=Zavarzinia sp. CC-PAN008 TaxID=3243332 RepID=UPI003F74925B
MTGFTTPWPVATAAGGGARDGFILVVTIWLAALLGLAALAITGWVGRGVDDTLALADAARGEAAAFSAEQRVLHALAVQRISARGLELAPPPPLRLAGRRAERFDPFAIPPEGQPFLALDGRSYRLGTVLVRVQDLTGLQSLAALDDQMIGRILRGRGLESGPGGRLADTLADYVDADSEQRLNGAEADDYPDGQSPRNAALVTPWEVRSVLGWDRWPALWPAADPVPRLFYAGGGGLLNPNTAPEELLRLVPGLDAAGARRLVRARQGTPLRGPDDLARLAGNPQTLDLSRYTFLPDGSFRIELVADGRARVREVAGRVTPQDERSPWHIDYVLDLPGGNAARPKPGDAVAPFPGTAS